MCEDEEGEPIQHNAVVALPTEVEAEAALVGDVRHLPPSVDADGVRPTGPSPA